MCENTPDASGNVWNELEPMIGKKFATQQFVNTRFIASPKTTKTRSNSFHALQRAAGRLPDWK